VDTFRVNEFKDKKLPTGPQIGFLAQEVEQVFPELVSTGTDGYKAVNYAQMTPVLLESIKEQQAQIETLKASNTQLQASLTALPSTSVISKLQADLAGKAAAISELQAALQSLRAELHLRPAGAK